MYATVQSSSRTKSMIQVSVLGVIGFIIMFLEIPLWFTPEFLKIDLSDLPALIGSFALGPVAGILIELIKNILHMLLKGTSTMGMGELANFIVGGAFVFTAGLAYQKSKTKAAAIRGMVLGTMAMVLIASAMNYVFLIPFYAKLYGMDVQVFVDMTKVVNPFVSDYTTFILFAIAPFNLAKGIIVSLVTFPIYKRVATILK